MVCAQLFIYLFTVYSCTKVSSQESRYVNSGRTCNFDFDIAGQELLQLRQRLRGTLSGDIIRHMKQVYGNPK
jgi:hypothetical protein